MFCWMYFYADDISLQSTEMAGLQAMLSICDRTLADLHLKFNNTKCFCIRFGPRHTLDMSPMNLCGDFNFPAIKWNNNLNILHNSITASGVFLDFFFIIMHLRSWLLSPHVLVVHLEMAPYSI